MQAFTIGVGRSCGLGAGGHVSATAGRVERSPATTTAPAATTAPTPAPDKKAAATTSPCKGLDETACKANTSSARV